VERMNGSFRRNIIDGEMEYKREIEIEKRFGLMLWNDWDANDNSIER
jgi:hypothetical protein